MRDRKVALRYAQALFEVALARDQVDPLEESLRSLVAVTDLHPEFAQFLQNPQVTLAQKKDLLHKVFDDRVELVVLQFLELLLEKSRILHLRDIQAVFTDLVEAHQGLQRAQVVTAVPLPADLESSLVDKLAAMTGRRISLDKRVDPSVLGGVCVTMGDQILDGTLRTGLQHLREVLETAPLRMS